MRHSNVLSVEGVAPELFELCMVSNWMSQGNMTQYLKDNKSVDRMKLVSSPVLSCYVDPCSPHDAQLLGITRGLDYLHSNEVIHGDLKGVSGVFNYHL